MYVHKNGIVYGDLKPENIVFRGNGHVVLVDFGSSKGFCHKGDCAASSHPWVLEGTTDYWAPEYRENADWNGGVATTTLPPSPAADVFAFGCLAFELFVGHPPRILDGLHASTKKLNSKVRIELPPEDLTLIPAAARGLVEHCLKREPVDRLGGTKGDFKEVLDHPFLSDIDTTLPPNVQRGNSMRGAEEKWVRRRMSILFSPMPSPYTSQDEQSILEETEVEHNSLWFPKSIAQKAK
uniref:Protein kinase domain-containing protein n=1 Tax=Palpitomonas bilix TaxID=652834 RepID=A0A7S3LXW4_9EUKA|mmetsp:Transcript_9351/g.25403  ORF Transcript_9351/g.25403 Transcript_9351/m.25403 type:complete len:238 (+) Transcript_9351:2165-2878(+)